MTASTIHDRDDLISYLRTAMVLEHATIPTYLTAYYSIKSTTNSDAAHIIRVVATEEMLHLTLVANVLNAIGGTPDLTSPGFVPSFPTYLPDGEDDFTIDLASKRVTRADGEEVRLTPTEWHVVETLVRNEGKLVSQRQLLQEVWGPQYGTETNYLRVYLAQVRRKLEPEPGRPRYFITEPGMGYRFERST